MNVFLIILFCLIYALISFVIVYANDTAEIANDDFETYYPNIRDLSEEERTDYCTVDNYIKNTICPRYHHQILRNEINHYQKDAGFTGLISMLIINASLSSLLLTKLSIEKWHLIWFVALLILGFICYFVVWVIYQEHSTLRIKNYYEIHSTYDWESHYYYLCSKKENVIYRHMLRNAIGYLALLCFVLVAIYLNLR